MIRRRNKPALPEASINLTSLLDITFVLLISFMVVAPALRYNVDLELPKVAESQEVSEKKTTTLQVNAPGGAATYFVNGVVTPLDEVPMAIKASETYRSSPVVSLEADRAVPWEDIARLINVLTAEGITSIGIITEKGG